MTPVLPVDSFIDEIRGALDTHRAAVLTAAPGAGKTTRVPPALIDRGRVLLLQPRRVAARAMASRIADERGWTLGREVGWHIRFDRRFSDETQLLVVTEGILTAYLQRDPLLSDVTTVVVDEFHERSVQADLGLAMARQAWLARPDLRILVMSATLDAAPVAAFLGRVPVISVPGSLFPLQIEYAPGQTVADAVRAVVPQTAGHVLCFLPGVREIREAHAACAEVGRTQDVEVVDLHGSLTAREQDAALSDAGGRRRVILATNIAETSLTVPGVSTVIDSGLHRVARYNAERAVDALVTERITQDSADQRAGRAARLGPGLAVRLWDARDRLRPHREAEIHRVDLSGVLLAIAEWGATAEDFDWFDRPGADRIAVAVTLLEQLGALAGGKVTPLGSQMQALPLSPRLARVLIAGHGSFEAAAACAWLSEPAPADVPAAASSSDLLPVIDHWPRMPPALKHVTNTLGDIAKSMLDWEHREHIGETELRRALFRGYGDRVARRRTGDRFTLASGHGAVLGRQSRVHGADWLIALDVTASQATHASEAIIRVASAVDPEWLTATRRELQHTFDKSSCTVKATEIDWYHAISLREHPVAPDTAERARILADTWLEGAKDEASQRLLQRLAFAGVATDVTTLVSAAAASATWLSEVTLDEALLPWDVQQRLSSAAPESITVPSGRTMTINYRDDGGVAVAVKLQELFGLAETPRIGPKQTPITFELLAPNGRPVQTTQDLKSFWERTYPEVRKELRGRYPRHPWPDDPWTATPTHKAKKRV